MHPVPRLTADITYITIITVITTETTATITTGNFTVIKMTDITQTEAITTMADFTEREDYRPDKPRKYMAERVLNTMLPDKRKNATTIITTTGIINMITLTDTEKTMDITSITIKTKKDIKITDYIHLGMIFL